VTKDIIKWFVLRCLLHTSYTTNEDNHTSSLKIMG